MMNFKPGDRIDLSKIPDSTRKEFLPNLESYRKFLKKRMMEIAEQSNAEFGENFLYVDGRIKMDNFNFSDLDKDQQYIDGKESYWASTENKSVREFKEDKQKHPANISEMAVTLVLSKILKDRFVVARSAVFDDYRNGVDNVLIDKQTGAVVCGFDAVIGSDNDPEGNKKEIKMEKVYDRDGAHLKYGITIEDGKLIKKSLSNIPTFYLPTRKNELTKLLSVLKNNENKLSQEEIDLFDKLLDSLRSQVEKLEISNSVNNANLKNNFLKFKDSLKVMEDVRKGL